MSTQPPDRGYPSTDQAGHDAVGSGPESNPPIAAVPAVHHHHEEHHLLRDPSDGDRWEWRRRIRRNPIALRWYRLGVAVAGATVMLLAALTGPLPGPGGIPLALIGLAIWSSEFAWAHRLQMYFLMWVQRFARLPGPTKAVIIGGIVVAALGIGYLGMVVVGPPAWLPDRLEAWLESLPGVK